MVFFVERVIVKSYFSSSRIPISETTYVIGNYCMSLLGLSKYQLVMNDLLFRFLKVQNVP